MPKIKIPVPTVDSFTVWYNSFYKSSSALVTFSNLPATYPALDNYNNVSNITGTSTAASASFPYSSGYTYNKLYLMAGTKPNQTEVDDMALNSSFDDSDSNPNMLVKFTAISQTTELVPASEAFKISLSCVNVSSALHSGQATYWVGANPNSNNSTPGVPYFVGDISDQAGNGELKLEDTNIVQGQDYLLTPFSFLLPATINLP